MGLEYDAIDVSTAGMNFRRRVQVFGSDNEKFEPRLSHVNVRHLEDPDHPMELRFEIVAELVSEEERASLKLETRIDGSGKVSVKG